MRINTGRNMGRTLMCATLTAAMLFVTAVPAGVFAATGAENLASTDKQQSSPTSYAQESTQEAALNQIEEPASPTASDQKSGKSKAEELASSAQKPAKKQPQSLASPALLSPATETELRTALESASTDSDAPTQISLTADIALSTPLTLAAGHYASLSGDIPARKLTAAIQMPSAQTSETVAVLQVSGGLSLANITVDAENRMRAVCVMKGGKLTLESGAVVKRGRLGEANGATNGGAGIRLQKGSFSKAGGALVMNVGSEISECSSAGSYSVQGIGLYAEEYTACSINGGIIKNCTEPATANKKANGGGAYIRNSGGTFVFASGEIKNNSVCGTGGGLHIESGNATISGGSIEGNRSAYGGGIYSSGQLTMTAGTIKSNRAQTDAVPSNTSPADRGNGGGVFVASGIFSLSGTAAITGNFAYYNMAIIGGDARYNTAQGGGIYVRGTLNMSGGSVSGNSAGAVSAVTSPAAAGGGIAVGGGTSPGTFNFTGGTITGNTAKNSGGGIYANSGESTLGLNVSTPTYVPGNAIVNLSGSPVCFGNTADSLYLPQGVSLRIAGPLTSGARLALNTEIKAVGTNIAISSSGYTASASDAYAFENASGAKNVSATSGGTLVLSPATTGKVSIDTGTIDPISPPVYTGAGLTPSITLKLGENTLTEGTDYTLSYRNNINAGTAFVVAIGTGSYSGRLERDFTITPKDLSDADIIALPIADRIYTGNELRPAAALSFNGTPLVHGTDFTAEYASNTEIGQATVTLTGIQSGNYTGSRSVSFGIISAAGLLTASDEASLSAAIASAAGTEATPDKIYVTQSISMASPADIPQGKYIELIGNDDGIGISPTNSMESLVNVDGWLKLSGLALDGADKARVCKVKEDADLLISAGSSVTKGKALDGAGIYVLGSLTIDGATVSGCRKNTDSGISAGHGGGIYIAEGGSAQITSGSIGGNFNTRGGGIYNEGTLTVTGGRISGNSASGSVPNGIFGYGGGICNMGTANIDESTATVSIDGNTATENGGGIYNAGELTLVSGRVEANKALGGDGGGIHTSGILHMSGGRISANETASGFSTFNPSLGTGSGSGGGVCVQSGSFDMTGGEIVGNKAGSTYVSATYVFPLANGGGVYVGNSASDHAIFTMSGGSISTNEASAIGGGLGRGNGGGIYIAGGNGTRSGYFYYPGSFAMTGGSITANSATDCGGGIYAAASLTFGDPAMADYANIRGKASIELSGTLSLSSNQGSDAYLADGISAVTRSGVTATPSSIGIISESTGNAPILQGIGTPKYRITASDAAAFANLKGGRIPTADTSANAVILKTRDIQAGFSVVLPQSSYEYSGSDIRPVPVVKQGSTGAVLAAGKDYTISYKAFNTTLQDYVGSDTKNASKKGVFIEGCGDYSGRIKADYTITPKPLTKITASIPKQEYIGTQLKPVSTITVNDGTKALLRGTDYTIASYGANNKAGTGTVVLKGIGNYSGTKTVSFTITAKSGFEKQKNGKYKYYVNGVAVVGFYKIKKGGKQSYFYFDSNGIMCTSWQRIRQSNGKYYRYYFGGASDGRMRTGWQTIKGKRYYFGGADDGKMKTGWQRIRQSGGKYYHYYFAGTNGGIMQAGWRKISGKRYYFGGAKDGKMHTGWRTIKGKRYYFGGADDGRMRTGKQVIGGKKYVFAANGVLVR